ncbi:creatininase [Prosthecomicrobium hirschii]|uniref:Creatininase n=1 Tax=Prosthecodimorpha hirschii TaxID=665126 RepID=A0A0P6VQS8_9HYPH|nr:creatininase family protein [Prosthecomicrobium hirschii]KPL54179.1 creatininase [Prosthecomicrobium hirschii]
MPPKRYWHELTSFDFRTPDVADWIAVLPVAAIEQHGPHLPVATDMVINEGHVARTLAILPADLPVLFLPTQAIGKSNEHISSPGTLTFTWETVTKAWLEIGDSVARAGVRKLVIINSHGGNVPIIDIVARELRVRHDMLVVGTAWSRFGQPDGLYGEKDRRFGIHGGEIETSIMLALRPDLVKMAEARDFRSNQENFEQEFKHLRAHGLSQFGWKAQDLNPDGTVGDASIATAAKGEASLDHAARTMVELLTDVHRFDPARLWRPA